MQKHNQIFAFFILTLAALILAACGPAAPTTAAQSAPAGNSPAGQPGWQEISIEQAAQKRDAGAFMLDVREPDEWNTNHIPGATLIPLGQLKTRLNELPNDQEIVVYCRSGNRSKDGAEILSQAGFQNVASMAGGINQWQAAGLPVEAGK